jgi:hypothetical protein
MLIVDVFARFDELAVLSTERIDLLSDGEQPLFVRHAYVALVMQWLSRLP